MGARDDEDVPVEEGARVEERDELGLLEDEVRRSLVGDDLRRRCRVSLGVAAQCTPVGARLLGGHAARLRVAPAVEDDGVLGAGGRLVALLLASLSEPEVDRVLANGLLSTLQARADFSSHVTASSRRPPRSNVRPTGSSSTPRKNDGGLRRGGRRAPRARPPACAPPPPTFPAMRSTS